MYTRLVLLVLVDVCGELATVYLLLVTVVRYIRCREDSLRVCCFTEVWFLSPVASSLFYRT